MHLAYKFNFTTQGWSIFEKDLHTIDLKFDKIGNYYILDDKQQMYAANSRNKVVLGGVFDFEVDPAGRFHVIPISSQGLTLNQWITRDGYTFKYYSRD
jgi:hypothetical protein